MNALNVFDQKTTKKDTFHKFTIAERLAKTSLGYTILNFQGDEYAVDLNSSESRDRFKNYINHKFNGNYDWFKEEVANKNWVFYGTDCFEIIDVGHKIRCLHYKENTEIRQSPLNMSSCLKMFQDIKFTDYQFTLDTENVIDMVEMFSGAVLTRRKFPIKDFYTGNVIDMKQMFSYCIFEEGIILPDSFDTANVKNMFAMFKGCTFKYGFRFPKKFNPCNVLSMGFMFYQCWFYNGDVLNEQFDTRNVKDMEYMFSDVKFEEAFYFPEAFNTVNCKAFSGMFSECNMSKGLYFSENFNTCNAIVMQGMFSSCIIPKDFKLPKKFILKENVKSYNMFNRVQFLSDGFDYLSDREIVEKLKIN